jgi:signal transduction histidine kinase
MLAAISHDLRTPITRLRLRVESVVEEGCEQQKMLEDLRRMDAMVASALSFLRDATQEEAVELVDVASLVQSVRVRPRSSCVAGCACSAAR